MSPVSVHVFEGGWLEAPKTVKPLEKRFMDNETISNFLDRERERDKQHLDYSIYSGEELERKIVKLHLCLLRNLDSIEEIKDSHEKLCDELKNENHEIQFHDRWATSLLDPKHFLDEDLLYYNFNFKEMGRKFYSALNIYHNIKAEPLNAGCLKPVSSKELYFFRASWREENFRNPIAIEKNVIRFYFSLIKYYNYNPILRIFKRIREGEK